MRTIAVTNVHVPNVLADRPVTSLGLAEYTRFV